MLADKPWERQEGETEKAYEAFLIYRDMGEKRTLTAVAEELQKSYTLTRRWKDRWNWAERARAYDNELDRQAQAKAVKDRKAMIDRHIGISMNLQAKALQALKELKAKELKPKDVIAMVDVAAKLERLSHGEAVEQAEGRQAVEREVPPETQIDLSHISDEELAKLDEITGKIFGK